MTYPTHAELSAVLAEINGGEMSCHIIARKLRMSLEDVAGCALVLMESNLITCDEVEEPDND
jgi:hypothetical protein